MQFMSNPTSSKHAQRYSSQKKFYGWIGKAEEKKSFKKSSMDTELESWWTAVIQTKISMESWVFIVDIISKNKAT